LGLYDLELTLMVAQQSQKVSALYLARNEANAHFTIGPSRIPSILTETARNAGASPAV